jgi:hypothetical protein
MKLQGRSKLGIHLALTGGLALVVSMAACGGTVNNMTTGSGGNSDPSGGGVVSGTGASGSMSGSSSSGMTPVPTTATKIDLLLMIDNSRSMADKQLILAAAVPDLVQRLVNPPCVDGSGVPQPAGPLDPCPAGTKRTSAPVTDLHIGVVSSSLGGHGADACSPMETLSCNGAPNPSNNDAGHLLARPDACVAAQIPTYSNKGFLAWDPTGSLTPKGEASVGEIAIAPDGTPKTVTPGLVASLKDLVQGVGQIGCGYESQFESWYRFLIDPDPYQTITIQGNSATPSGTDTLLLEQRADFLRPSSLLAIVMLTDENDCSIKETGQFYFAAQQRNPADPAKKFHLPRARKECLTNPNDPCCKSCGQTSTGCPADATCASNPTLSDAEDDVNLRCYDQKRRFGIDFLYPIDRYTQALHNPTVPSRDGSLVPNPIFSDLVPGDADSSIRGADLVVVAGIVGVPWQSIARDAADLTKGFRNADEMLVKDATGRSTWDVVLGDPANYVPPVDPHMVESSAPRPGLPGPASAPNADPINGHEYTNTNNDLQYACVFSLPTPRDCSGNTNGCDCGNSVNDNPLCDPNNTALQVRAKGYPGLRELALLKSVGTQGVVGSVCPAQLQNNTQADYGYRPAMAAIAAALKPHLVQ